MEWADVGERVRESRLAAGMSQAELASAVGLERTKIAKIESGGRQIDALELAKLAAALKVPMGHFLREQPTVLSRRTSLVDDTDSALSRDSYRLEAKLMAWLDDIRQVVALGLLEPRKAAVYDRTVTDSQDAREAALWLRNRQGLGQEPIRSLMAECERVGQYVLVSDLPGDGASLMEGEFGVSVVSRLAEPGRRRATAAHELGHLVLGDEYSTDLGVSTSREDRERVIDAFAAEFLLPSEVLEQVVKSDLRSELIKLSAVFRTSWSLTVRQAGHVGLLDGGRVTKWFSDAPTRAELRDAVGWVPQPDLEGVRVPPSYAHAVHGGFATALRHACESRRAHARRGRDRRSAGGRNR
ncbi:XRE family transcriptional regulator [Amycolatopsis sp. QT-25]|uniref:XRE family transcriptional regulator n=1 Tax=Amycolatopsis sp. QT-25 TaxID=3034022 RepID=UPI0023EB6DAC|nr:XRE family transcriptional regulator [Amycolatopsis sp. QT-25]WET81870.1 XRE family transcriptional regulator [Amycolatopsis sp. QT-25]